MLKLRSNGKIILNGVETNFLAQEFLPPEVYNHPTRNPLWYLDEQTVALAQFYREWWGVPVYLNDWHKGGERDLAGFRTPETGIVDYALEHGLSNAGAEEIKNHFLSMRDNTEEEITLGSWWSQHKFARAIDPIIKGLSADDARSEIMDNESAFMDAGLTTLESGAYAPTWVHSDRRPTGLDHILIVGV